MSRAACLTLSPPRPGRLVSVKFIREERYHERYPDAAQVTVPMRPSNGLRRSLADLPAPVSAEDD